MSDIREQVINIISERLEVDKSKVTDDARFQEDLGADSLDTTELVLELEEHFDCEIPDEEAEKIQTVKDAIRYIEQQQAEK